MDDSKVLLEKLAKAISFKYKGGVAPGITVSWLPTNEWYVSIVKYGTSHKDKQVMYKCKSATLSSAIKTVTVDFLSSLSVERNPVDDLRDAVST